MNARESDPATWRRARRAAARRCDVATAIVPVARMSVPTTADAEDPAALSARAKELAAAGDHDEATELYSKALELQCAPREPVRARHSVTSASC